MRRMLFIMLLISCTDGADDVDTDVDAGHDAAPVAVCLDDQNKCDVNILMMCAGGQWIVEEDCAAKEFVCEDNLDGLAACTHGCDHETDTMKCYENKVMSCDLSQIWQEVEDCSAIGRKCVQEITNSETTALCI